MSEQPVDPELIGLACQMAGCEPDHLLRATWAGGALTVQAEGRPSYVFTAAQIAEAVAADVGVAMAVGLHQRPAPGWYEAHIAPAAQRSGVAPAHRQPLFDIPNLEELSGPEIVAEAIKQYAAEVERPLPDEPEEPERKAPPRRRRAG